jgi:hypothetical protein
MIRPRFPKIGTQEEMKQLLMRLLDDESMFIAIARRPSGDRAAAGAATSLAPS